LIYYPNKSNNNNNNNVTKKEDEKNIDYKDLTIEIFKKKHTS